MKIAKDVVVRWSVLLAIAAGSWYGYRTLYASKRDVIQSDIRSARSSIESLEGQLSAQFEISDRSKAAAATTLGVKLDEVSARFRDGLSRIAESNGLTGVIVDHGEPQEVKSPLLVAKSVPAVLKSTLRNSPDFSVLRGTLRASGTVEQALATLASVQSQPWVHRIEGFTLRPGAGGKDASRCEIRIEAATLLAPRLRSEKTAEPVIAQTDESVKAMLTQIVNRRVLAKAIVKTPDAAPTVTVAAPTAGDGQPAPVAPQPFAPYEEWRLTGIFTGRSGPEAFFVNIKSGQRVTVQRGGAVLDAVFIDALGERAILDIGGKRFEVLNGQVLSSRKPVV
jgi:hypothetical protein